MPKRKRQKTVGHWLLTITISPHEYMHGYIMTDNEDDLEQVACRMIDEAIKLGSKYPLMNIILQTKLDDTCIKMVQDIVSEGSEEAKEYMADATKFHLTVVGMPDCNPNHAKLMGLH
jgi:hypothetical protein